MFFQQYQTPSSVVRRCLVRRTYCLFSFPGNHLRSLVVFSRHLLDVNVSLWKGDADVGFFQGVPDGKHHLGFDRKPGMLVREIGEKMHPEVD